MKSYLFKENEKINVKFDSRIENHPELNTQAFEKACKAGEQISLAAGSYLIHEETPAFGTRTRYLGIVGEAYTVTQMTVGAFTSDNMDNILHRYRVPGVYYVTMEQAQNESTYKYYQREYGDDVLPHIMANGLSLVNPKYKQLDPNWESLSKNELTQRLEALKCWWKEQSYTPLAGIASYTPCNALVRALKEVDLPILHSLCPEQNWSDGKWAINHWGMPNQPYYIASDDFRKQTVRAERNVLGMCMNAYNLYMPHIVNWGDNVLSPSHYLRWHRTVESRYQPERYTNLMLDYLKAVDSSKEPFFLIAGYEFGRTFGTTSMTDHNRKGMKRLILAAKDAPIVFATASDVADYYERHITSAPDKVWTQRDYLAGTRIMGKPINSGPSIGMEMLDYKAVFEHKQNLPFYFYDYNETWSFAYNDTNAPDCFAHTIRDIVDVKQCDTVLKIKVSQSLNRKTPIAIWDAEFVDAGSYVTYTPGVLDDGRHHQVIELPAGFGGELMLEIKKLSDAPAAEFEGISHTAWKVHTIGEEDRKHCIVFLDSPLTQNLEFSWTAPKAGRLDDIDRPILDFSAGDTITLRFTPRKPWIRFWGLEASNIVPNAEMIEAIKEVYIGDDEMQTRLEAPLGGIHAAQDKWVRSQIPDNETIVYDIDCFGYATTQEKSRAFSLDRTVVENRNGVVAKEYADGGLAFAPGQSYWCHPRKLHVEIENLQYYLENNIPFKVHLICSSPADKDWSYKLSVKSGFKELEHLSTKWSIPKELNRNAVCSFEVNPEELEIDNLSFWLSSDQIPVLNDWFKDGGFISGLQRLVITEIH